MDSRLFNPDPVTEVIGPGATLLRGFAASETASLLNLLLGVSEIASWQHMTTPGGHRMSVAMTSCGDLGWVSDRSGYRYATTSPSTQQVWPPMPTVFRSLAQRSAAAAGYVGIDFDTCLINRYEPGARMSMHQDRDERDLDVPIVSVSLGLPATFLFGGLSRKDAPKRLQLRSGDIAVWGGLSRLAFHGILPLKPGVDSECGPFRYNLTFRKAR